MMTIYSEIPGAELPRFKVGSIGVAWSRARIATDSNGDWYSTIFRSDDEQPTPVKTLDLLHDLIGVLHHRVKEDQAALVIEDPTRMDSYVFPASWWPVLKIEVEDSPARAAELVRDEKRDLPG